MSLQPCNHIRVRDCEGYEKNIETLVKSIENQFKTDFTSLPNWKDLLKNIGDKKQEYKSKIKSANRRKLFIIDKLHVQNFRPSPFSLTDNLARTAYLWKDIELEHKKRREFPKLDTPSILDITTDIMGEISDINFTAHPNSEIYQSIDLKQPIIQATPVEVESSVTHLPVNICTNPHKLLSSLESEFSELKIEQKESQEHFSILGSQDNDGMLVNQTKYIICKPSALVIDSNITKKQVVKFVLTNTFTEALYIRFKTLSDKSPFKRAVIYPVTPTKLCTGLSMAYNFVFKLIRSLDNVKIYIIFRIGRNTMSSAPEEILSIPLYIKPSEQETNISVTETVHITPVYAWQINVNANLPHENLEISIIDGNSYYMHIKKRVVDFIRAELHNPSIDVTGVNTASLLQKMEDDFETPSALLSQSRKDNLSEKMECTSMTVLISLVVEDIVNLALDTFIFERTFLYLAPYSKSCISILFAKAEHEGYHQCYYDLEFYDPDTDFLIATKTIKVFAEALSHPVRIYPKILDMSESPINFGYREDYFVVSNTHKLYSVTLKVSVTNKMKRLFQISPMKTTIPCGSSEHIVVRVCSKLFNNDGNTNGLVHFTIKITVSGHASVYRNVPPIFYEIIIPCAAEFNKIYADIGDILLANT